MYLVILLPLGMLVCGPPTNCGKVLDCPRCGGLSGVGFLASWWLVCLFVPIYCKHYLVCGLSNSGVVKSVGGAADGCTL